MLRSSVLRNNRSFDTTVPNVMLPTQQCSARKENLGVQVPRITTTPGILRGEFPKGPSPIKMEVLEDWLLSYPNRQAANFLVLGFKLGFRIPAIGPRVATMSKNLKSIIGMEAIVTEKIDKEVRVGRVLGPFPIPPVDDLRVSPLPIVPKNAAGEFRLIYHLSYPAGDLVNDMIPQELCTVRYVI